MNPQNPYASLIGSAPPGPDLSQYNRMFGQQAGGMPPGGMLPQSMAQRLGGAFRGMAGQQPGQPGMRPGQMNMGMGGANPFIQALAAYHARRQGMGGMGQQSMPTGAPNPGQGQSQFQWPPPVLSPWGQRPPGQQPAMPFRPQGQQVAGPPGSQG